VPGGKTTELHVCLETREAHLVLRQGEAGAQERQQGDREKKGNILLDDRDLQQAGLACQADGHEDDLYHGRLASHARHGLRHLRGPDYS